MNKQLVRVWNVNLADGRKVRAATIEQGPRQPSMCDGCPAPCCRGIFQPILTSAEFLERKFRHTFIPAPDWLKERVPRAQYLVTLRVDEKQCEYFDLATGMCSIYPNCPKSCMAYDCREDPRLEKFAKEREKEWQAQ